MTEVLRLAEANPFYITQLAEAYAQAAPGGRGAPAGRRAWADRPAIGRFVRRRARLVQTLSVLGRDCPLDLLTRIVDLPLTELAATLDEGLAARVLAERDAPGGPAYDVAHALLREAAVRDLSAIGRARLHLRIAEALAARRGPGIPAGEIADHYLAARPLADRATALAYAREAADEALALGSPEQGRASSTPP
ncbi:MAG: hypothetical protein U0531_20870 [Dehalococcoidia bacterium]